MLSKEIRESQVALELPAREMLAFFNWSRVSVYQTNANYQLGLLNVNAGQINNATIVVAQS